MLLALRKFLALNYFFNFANKIAPWLLALSLILLILGFYLALFVSPPDYQQADCVRIIYVHVPAAFLSLSIYCLIGLCSTIFLIWHIKLADIIVTASINFGIWTTILALLTGAIWAKPMWGTWWVWDARLSSEFVLLLLYVGIYALRNAIPNTKQAAKLSALLAIVGLIDIPIIHFSVNWWYTLHQGPTLSQFAKPPMDSNMLITLLICIAGFYTFYLAILCQNINSAIMLKNKACQWVKQNYAIR